jgi:hypothetical protein
MLVAINANLSMLVVQGNRTLPGKPAGLPDSRRELGAAHADAMNKFRCQPELSDTFLRRRRPSFLHGVHAMFATDRFDHGSGTVGLTGKHFPGKRNFAPYLCIRLQLTARQPMLDGNVRSHQPQNLSETHRVQFFSHSQGLD